MPSLRPSKFAFAVAACLALSSGVIAEPPSPAPPQSVGQDVVVSGIGSSGGSAPYGDSASLGVTTDGSVGAITAFSVGTISCNIGNADAIWIRSTAAGGNRHPVIGTQIYRYTTVGGAGRFEQIGLNWLKHGFCAADASNCTQLVSPTGTLASNGSCDWLGKFATDTYGAGLNGSQSNLGPRSDINPWTGVYPYPYTIAWSQTGDAIFKRTQVKTSDLGGGANYVVEVMYITTDEPGRNRYNNYSYRMASSSGTTIGLTGPTKQGRPAIYAWKEQIDPTVTLVNIDPSGVGDAATDGRLVLGYKVTQTGPSTWHYEYALQNMNNDRSVSGFAVPVGTSVSLSNNGFHDVFYHSGEPYTGTDWTFANSGGTASWTMVNDNGANSNALRWGTTYNFRFDCNQPPIAGNATLTMFKTGTPTTVSVAVQIPAVPPPPTPGPFQLTAPAAGATVPTLTPTLAWKASNNADSYTVTVANDSALSSVVWTTSVIATSAQVAPATLTYNGHYWWGITAVNGEGTKSSTPTSFDFFTVPPPCSGDLDGDGHTGTSDLTFLLGNFGTKVPANTGGDLDGDGAVGTADLTALLGNFGC